MSLAKKIIIYKYGDLIREADLNLITDTECTLSIEIFGKKVLSANGFDFFECFRNLRELDKLIIYYCKGSKINVLASRMSRQMSRGLSAYETTLGKQALKADLVNIFDYDDQNLARGPKEQDDYLQQWFASLSQ